MTRMTPELPDKPCQLQRLTQRALMFLERPLGEPVRPERPFLFQKSPARDRVNAKPDPAVPASSAASQFDRPRRNDLDTATPIDH
jgi:hypothetical protein